MRIAYPLHIEPVCEVSFCSILYHSEPTGGERSQPEAIGGKQSKKAEGASITNKQKSKKKNFSMMKHKIKAKGKKSFREKQVALKKRLVKIAKNSH